MIDEKEILKSAVDMWGINMQKIICMEECGELIQALAKSMRPSREDNLQTHAYDLGHIAEEIADVELCLTQMKIAMPDIIADIEQIKTEKIDRLKSRILKSYIDTKTGENICHEEIDKLYDSNEIVLDVFEIKKEYEEKIRVRDEKIKELNEMIIKQGLKLSTIN